MHVHRLYLVENAAPGFLTLILLITLCLFSDQSIETNYDSFVRDLIKYRASNFLVQVLKELCWSNKRLSIVLSRTCVKGWHTKGSREGRLEKESESRRLDKEDELLTGYQCHR